MQQLKTTIQEINGVFYIPLDDNLKLLREQNELLKENEKLKKQLAEKEAWVTGLGWLKKQVGIQSEDKLRELILLPNKKVLSVEYGGPVKFSSGRGSNWRFEPVRMKQFLQENFSKILTKE